MKLNRRGMSLVEILVSLALLSGLVYVVITTLNVSSRISKKTKGSESCEVLVKSFESRLQKGAGSPFIVNLGPDATGHFSDADVYATKNAEWGTQRLRAGYETLKVIPKTPVLADEYTTGKEIAKMDGVTIATQVDVETLTAGGAWQFNNYATIDNAINNMIALVNENKVDCVPGLARNEAGGPIGRDVSLTLRTWLPNEYANAEIGGPTSGGKDEENVTRVTTRMAVDIVQNGKSLCAPAPQPIKDINPVRTMANYIIQVDLNDPVAGFRRCEAQGTVNFAKDDSPPLVAVRIVGAKNGALCNSVPGGPVKKGVPSLCTDANPTVEIEAATFKDTTACRTCLANIYKIDPGDNKWPITRAEAANGTCAQQKDAIADCEASCQPGDPGSIFFCRLGEKNWLGTTTAGNKQDDWQPCHTAYVHDWNGKMLPATVETSYGTNKTGKAADVQYGASRTYKDSDLNSWVKIKMSNLSLERAYQFDVRAVDSAGKFVSPSFCSMAGDACTPESGYGVAVAKINNNPSLGDIRTADNKIAKPVNGPEGQVEYDYKLMSKFPDYVQCSAGAFSLVSNNVIAAPLSC